MSDYTPFQRKVFQAVAQIPFGQRRSYQWVARKIGRPKAARAVGAALRKNKHLIVVPCHRVVRANGSLGGYVLGKRMKQRLLDLENKLTQGE